MARRPTAEEVDYAKRAASMLLFPTSAWATGMVLFHRYCDYISNQQPPDGDNDIIPSHLCIMLCLYLAAKATEEPRKQRDIINVGYKLDNPESEFLPVDERMYALCNTMTQAELVLIRVLGFNVNVDLPHSWIASILYGMTWWEQKGIPPDDTELVDIQVKNIARLAWLIADNVVIAGLVDREPVQAMAAACILIALQVDGIPLPAKNLTEWADVWARSSASRVERVQRLIEDNVNIDKCKQERDSSIRSNRDLSYDSQ
ncbi:hypothetical protein LPJ71_005471 [Coemansia sp. S17]|nr:hypothetical protein LPJ71_005471 [Coemansia sp. S17]